MANMKVNKISIEEIESIIKEISQKNGYNFPEYDGYGNIKLTNKNNIIIMNAKSFDNEMKKQYKSKHNY